MEEFGIYLLKSVIWLTGFALVYTLFLRNERFFMLNRFFLIGGILSSVLLPFLTIRYTVFLPVPQELQEDNAIVNVIQSSGRNNPDTGTFLLFLYFSGIILVAFFIIKQSISIIKSIKKSQINTNGNLKIVRTSDHINSFSFFSYVFVNPSVTDIEIKEIMNHEEVHIRQKHWVDLMLSGLLSMIQWFNPVTWVYARFIRQNHEYLADEVALQRTTDPAIYRATLLNQIIGSPVVILTNSFNYSLNKKRFNMMTNIITSPYRKMKILFILPVIAIVLYAFARPDYKYVDAEEDHSGISSISATLTKEVKGYVIQDNGKPLEGATILVRGTNTGTSATDKGYFKLDNIPEDGLLVVTYVGFKSKVIKPDFNSEMSIKMVRDTVKFMGSDIGTPPPPQNLKIRNTNGGPSPLVVIDGVITDIEITKVDAETIKSINVLKDETAVEKYGEKGSDGVIEVTTKKADQFEEQSNLSETKVSGNSVNQNIDNDVFVIIEEMPEFPGGGRKAMTAWINANLKYPAEAVKAHITGKVNVDFMVSSTGKIKSVHVSNPVNPLLDAEAKRVISNMPDWKPGSQAGKPVDVQIMVPVEFKL